MQVRTHIQARTLTQQRISTSSGSKVQKDITSLPQQFTLPQESTKTLSPTQSATLCAQQSAIIQPLVEAKIKPDSTSQPAVPSNPSSPIHLEDFSLETSMAALTLGQSSTSSQSRNLPAKLSIPVLSQSDDENSPFDFTLTRSEEAWCKGHNRFLELYKLLLYKFHHCAGIVISDKFGLEKAGNSLLQNPCGNTELKKLYSEYLSLQKK